MDVPPQPVEQRIHRRFLPFAAVGLVVPLLAALPPQPEKWAYVWIAAGLTVVIAAAGVFVPWSRVPRSVYVLPPLAYFVVVALLRQANDGSVSGYAPLALLPVVWIALNLGRTQVAIGVVAGTAVFVLPFLVGDPEQYGPGEWRRAILWALVAIVVGFVVESLMRDKRRSAREAREQAAALARGEQTMARVAELARGLTASEDTRLEICRAALDVSGGSTAAIVEPDVTGQLVITARVGPGSVPARFAIGESAGTSVAFGEGERLFVADVRDEPDVLHYLMRASGMTTGLFEPIRRHGETVGVLAVGWRDRTDDVGEQAAQAIGLLAAEAAIAIERADLLARLEQRARTDELTGLPNRRAWDETASEAVGTAALRRNGLCVAVIDLDHFKAFNDEHGHQAGDRLLKAAASSWRRALRNGDTLARYGGEEFAVALPDCTLEEAERVLERLRALTPHGLTCSVGVACWDGRETDVELLGRADAALYEAKRAGRDALVVAA